MILLRKCPKCGPYPGDLSACPKCGESSESHLPAPIDPRDWAYDIETYPNVFTFNALHMASGTRRRYEISYRVNQRDALVAFLFGLRETGARMVGFNNIGFDYPVIHHIVQHEDITVREIYNKAMEIIRAGTPWEHTIWPNDRVVPQIDLFKIHHFDNKARATSLKALEFAMRMASIEDLPFAVGTELSNDQITTLHVYNDHDVNATAMFYARTLSEIKFREQLTEKYNRDFMNHNDTKIGKDYFVMELESHGVECFYRDATGQRSPRQTTRGSIRLADVIFPYVRFERSEFDQVKQWLASQEITGTKGVFTGVNATVDGLVYNFGTGGLHASVESQTVHSDERYQLVDVDVASYYPNLAIVNGLYPEHLGEYFCKVYMDVYEQRKSYPKGTAENAMLKLALNGVYGDSNNKFSPFYDPQYTMSITINGQLLLCVLAEQLIKTPGLRMVQCNTDGVTFLCPREHMDHQRAVCKWWEGLTGLTLEEALYKSMYIRDVNNYLAAYEDGKVKRKGAYEHARQWHQDQSALVVPKAAEAVLVHGKDPAEFIRNHADNYDFMLRAKVPRSSRLVMRWGDIDVPMPNIIRYYVSTDGGTLHKIMPPTGPEGTWKRRNGISDDAYATVRAELNANPPGPEVPRDSAGKPWDERIHTKNKSVHKTREIGIGAGQTVTDCSDVTRFDRSTVDYDWYIAEARKLIDPVLDEPVSNE